MLRFPNKSSNPPPRNYNCAMARGWESKSVEAQQAEADQRSAKRGAPMTAKEAARWREKESLRLSRQRVLQQLEVSTNPRHRKLLQDTLADLDQQLSRAGK
jgi:vacuolar-type H+-ATPase subunit E/Vma4